MSYDPAGGQPGNQGWQGGQQPPYPPPPGGYGQQQPAGWGPPPGGPSGAPAQKSFFSALFDFTFDSFATPGLIRILYIIGTVLIVLGWLGYVVIGFSALGAAAGIGILIFGAIFALFAIALLRVSLEFYYAVVRMSEDIHHRR
ncbi:DUF4282 domain-containing protein [Pseudonocardia hydrocarbonoxydans]|jgi:hypothetical protein|uniref:DUF4282 domain-containing protein n=1 Tax=Pseudonocardia hydrocarbonoxydans TaxID=76726 RepID=A0A4Y3WR96_9PSEU|nr:DUF4282 domain-containing protein [Pseudonocardia hydrocarbonoxydans]GEC20791.1 hypothetical protein PHY01_30740 [Pseudonocardia hydrocarbonoxydans]